MSIGIVPRSFGTHSGSCHADEVTACALLLKFEMIDRSKIIRTREERRLVTCEFVCDVGGEYDSERKRFDHHQVGYTGDLSSAGMVLRYLFERQIIPQKLYDYLNRTIIHGIDQIDNGKWEPKFGYCSFSQIISTYGPVIYDATDEQYDQGFFEALDFTLGLLERFLVRYNYITQCQSLVQSVMAQMNECLIFEKAMPWMEAFFELDGEDHPAEFVIMPSGNHWKLRGIPPSYDRKMEVRRPLPKEWAGLLAEDLKRVSGISGGIFCHKGRFISVWETKEDAIRALKVVLERR